MYSAAERFLLDFHQARPGVTEEAFGELAVRCGGRDLRSSYAALAEAVPAHARRVLDLACGSAPLQRVLALLRPTAAYLGVDFSIGELRQAPDAALVAAARAQALPLPDASVDAVVSHMALMLMDDTPGVLDQIARVLPKGGVLAAVLPAARPPSPAFDAYVQLLRRELAALPAPAPRLGDGSWRDESTIQAALARHFERVAFDLLELEQQLTPEAGWASLLKTYDLYHLHQAARERIRTEWFQQARRGADREGRLTLPLRLRRLRCTRR